MGDVRDGLDISQKKSQQQMGFPESTAAELLSTPVEKITELGTKFKKKADETLSSVVENSSLARYGLVTVEGLAYTVPGVVNAVYHNLSNLPETSFKVATAATIGLGLRLAMPEKGAARALVGTTMGYFFVRDAIRPFVEAYKDVGDAKDLSTIHKSARKMGNGLGLFAVDSYIGVKVGKWAEAGTGYALKSTLGTKDYLAFENSKELFWNSDKYPIGRGLNWVAKSADRITGALADRLMIKQERQELSLDEQLKRVDEAGKRTKRNREDGEFYKYGPRMVTGEHLSFSEYLDQLLSGEKLTEPKGAKSTKPDATTFNKAETEPKILMLADPGTPPGDSIPPQLEIRRPEAKIPAETKAPLPPMVTGQTAVEYDPSNLAKLAQHAQRVQKAWGDEAVQIADVKDSFQSPVISISDATRNGALLGPEYNHSMGQLVALAQQIQNSQHLQEAGPVLDLHARAALQHQMKVPGVMDLNMFAEELHGVFLRGLRKAGVSDAVLSGKVPSRVTISNDGGSGNFTIPNIDGVIERPVTVFPRNQTGLLGVFAGINRHEQLGHDHVYGDLARFPQELRETLIGNAVKNAMEHAKIDDVDLAVPGLGTIKKSEFFKKLLIAEANENTADIVGTATGGADTALSLGILLQSLRKGGQLETRNVMGSQFADFFEPHGIDRWRIKQAAEVIRQLSNGDEAGLNIANALDSYAHQASRAGDSYIWASTDHPGQSVSIPMSEWDGVIQHIVKAQLDTPLEALESKAFRAILPDLPPIMKKIDALGTYMADSVKAGSDKLTIPFDKAEFTIGQVFSAGLVAWMRATAQGEDPARALGLINKISDGLRSQYRDGNPHAVTVAPSTLDAVRTSPLKVASNFTGRVIQTQPDLRLASARYATHMGSASTYLLMEDILRAHRLKKELESPTQH